MMLAINPWLNDTKAVVDTIGAAVTALAVVVGGLWAYFKFLKGRTYRPRLDINAFGQWRLVKGRWLLQARITVKNIGASKVELLTSDSGLRVSKLVINDDGTMLAWDPVGVWDFFVEDTFIESQETLSDDLLLPINCTEPVTTFFEARLVWKWTKGKEYLVATSRKVIPINSCIDGSESGESPCTADKIGGAERTQNTVNRLLKPTG